MGTCCIKTVPLKEYKISYKDDKKTEVKNNNALNKEDSKIDLLQSTVKFPVDFDFFKSKEEDKILVLQTKSKNIEFKFKIHALLGEGSFGKVYLVSLIENEHLCNIDKNKVYAMKVIEKKLIKSYKFENQTKLERILLEKINNPFVIKLEFAFQSESSLFLITEFGQGGDLFYHLQMHKKMELDRIKLYLAELIIGLEGIHQNKMVYRDMKPENILIDKYGHIKITDFGLSKLDIEKDQNFSLVGSPGYFAPEILLQNKYDYRVDYWSLGVIFYQFLEGKHPFESVKKLNPTSKNALKFKELLDVIPTFNDGINVSSRDFCRRLLDFDPDKRFKNSEEIKKHCFFEEIYGEEFSWDKVMNKEYKPLFIPEIKNDFDTKYFHKCFTDQSFGSLIFNQSDNNIEKSSIEQSASKENKSSDYIDFTYINTGIIK